MCSTRSWCHQSGLYAVSHLPNVQRPAHGPPTKQRRWLPDAEACAELSHWTSAKLSVEDLSLRRVARKDSPKSSVDSSRQDNQWQTSGPRSTIKIYQIEPHLWLAAVFPTLCWWTLMKLRWKSYGNHPWRWRPTNAEPCCGHLWSIRLLKSGGQRSHPKVVMLWQGVFHGKPRFSGTNFLRNMENIRWNLGNLPGDFWTS